VTLRYALLGLVPLLPLGAQPRAPKPDLKFEVASFKPSPPDAQAGGIIRPLPGNQTYIGTNMPLISYIMIAYTLRDTQISGGPSWLVDRFDMKAKADHPCTVEELHIMLQNLLIERFHMQVHRETREGPTYSLVIDKEPPKLTAHDEKDLDHPPLGGFRSSTPGMLGMTGTNADMGLLALGLSRMVDRTVIDKTRLEGHWDFKLEYVPDRPQAVNGEGAAAPPPDGPNIFDALRQQLNLRLEPSKGPIEHLVIDHMDKLTGN
jgi:uncharacterized protein (TIGR03435 family)